MDVYSRDVPRDVQEKATQAPNVVGIDYPYIRVLQGRDGRDGLPGRDGEDGERGERGEKGERGKKGDSGDTGPMGLKGEKGDHGETGAAGPRGIAGAAGPPGPRVAGATYVRWGRTSCPSGNGSELLYAGRAAGRYYEGMGGDLLCLPNNPEYLSVNSPTSGNPTLSGVEFRSNLDNLNMINQNAPCAVCYTPTRSTMVMIPAWIHCPASWTMEYVGYIMTSRGSNAPLQHVCVDQHTEFVPGEASGRGGMYLYHVEVECSSGILCPPYITTKEVTCTVCTK